MRYLNKSKVMNITNCHYLDCDLENKNSTLYRDYSKPFKTCKNCFITLVTQNMYNYNLKKFRNKKKNKCVEY